MRAVHTIEVRRMRLERSAPTRRGCEAAASLGATVDDLLPTLELPALRLPLAPGDILAIEGPSGSGKSRLLARVVDALREHGWTVIHLPARRLLRDVPCVDLFAEPVEDAMRFLSRAGLGEAACFLRRPGELSSGQLFRLRLALAMRNAELAACRGTPVALAIDEFASHLDDVTAASVAHLLARWARRDGRIGVIAAASRSDALDALNPDARWRAGHAWSGSPALPTQQPPAPPPLGSAPAELLRDLIFEPGRIADYHELARLHYRAARPATVSAVHVARDTRTGDAIGVMVVSMPTLNGAWRALAWPGRYAPLAGTPALPRGTFVERMNRELRCISRVIVEPRWRGRGVATELVRRYLASPLSKHTEAVAAMGRTCRFFEAAGMRRCALPLGARAARFLDAMEFCGVERWRLAMPAQALERAIASRGRAFVEHEVRLWAGASRAAARHRHDPLESLFARACRNAAAERVAYAA